MGQAAYKTVIKKSGTSTSFTDEAMSNVSGNTFSIDDANKQIWDRAVVPTFEEDAVPILASDISSIDYLFGEVTFATAKTGSITTSGNYIPTADVIGANSYTLNCSNNLLDESNFKDALSNNGFRNRCYGIHDVVISLSRFFDLLKTYVTPWLNRDVVLIEIKPGNGTEIIRGWYKIENDVISGDVSALETEAISFQLDGDINSSFSWKDV